MRIGRISKTPNTENKGLLHDTNRGIYSQRDGTVSRLGLDYEAGLDEKII